MKGRYFPMGLFDKKYCDFCGNKIGLLGNKKLEDGNMCKDCASKLSPWFSERRHSTKADIQEQLNYREQNRAAVAAFNTTRTLGKSTKLLIDDNARKFMVTSSTDLAKANPDVLDFSQAVGCDLEIQESRNELKQKDANGRPISYNPPRFEYSYCFYVTIRVNAPYFDDMRFGISSGYIKTGEQQMNATPAGWNIRTSGVLNNIRLNEYYDCVNLGNQIKEAVDQMRTGAIGGGFTNATPASAPAPAAPAGPVICPCCGAKTVPDANGCCEYCGSSLNA